MSRKRTNKKIINAQARAHKALAWAKFKEFGRISMVIMAGCPYCDQAFKCDITMFRINPDHQHVFTCPSCHKKTVKKVGKGFTKQIREGGVN